MKVLLIASAEICHQPRLIKAGDFFASKGWEVTVFNPVTGLAEASLYQDFKERKNWAYIENDISKKDTRSKINWLLCSIINKLSVFLFSIGIPLLNPYFANKGLVTAKIRGRYDLVIVNLIDNLPFAFKLKKNKKTRAIIYDSQEYFKGQFADELAHKAQISWISKNENKFIGKVDLTTTTTEALREQLVNEYKLMPSKVLRVRNVPSTLPSPPANRTLPENFLNCIWHGFRISISNERGVGLLLDAVSSCDFPVTLTLQGQISSLEYENIQKYIEAKKMHGKIQVRPPADPEKIVQSLCGFDVGLLGEIPTNMNQRLTSSNKLFEFIAAGLMVVGPDLNGIAETFDEYQIGLLYEPGNVADLIDKLRQINATPQLLEECKSNAIRAFAESANWEADYEKVFTLLQDSPFVST